MATQTFPCPFCGKKMGVGSEYLGKKVRCPNPKCNQVLVAPSPTNAARTNPPATAAKSSPPAAPEPQDADLPEFNIPSQEARESIFGEHSSEGEDLFDANPVMKPELPDAPPPPPKTKAAESSFAPTLEMKNPFSGPSVPPVPSPQPVPIAGNPWAGMDDPSPAPVPTPTPSKAIEPDFSDAAADPEPKSRKKKRDADREEPAAERRFRPAAADGSRYKVGFFVLAPYALIVTILAIYALFFKSGIPAGHPLANLPDNFGEYGPAERKKTSLLRAPVDGEIPPEQRVALGGKLTIGQILVEPLAVEQRHLKFIRVGKNEKPIANTSTSAAIVLKLKITNASEDMLIHPLDPAFNRKVTGNERIGTGLAIGTEVLWGGAIVWPYPGRVERVYEEAQEAETVPLKPGESREYVVFTDSSPRAVRSVREANGPLLWRVQVRHGRIDFNGKDVPVTAIIGVEFQKSDVKEL